MSRKPKQQNPAIGCIFLIAIAFFVYVMINTEAGSNFLSSPSPTPKPSPTSALTAQITAVTGVQSAPIVYTAPVESGGSQAVVEVLTDPGYNNPDTATAIFALALEELMNTYEVPAPIYFSVIIDDGTTAVDYTWDHEASTWRTTLVVQQTPEPSRTPQPTITAPPPTPVPRTPRPDNCATAVAMGMSAVEAARYSHLDRDKDGVACYGD